MVQPGVSLASRVSISFEANSDLLMVKLVGAAGLLTYLIYRVGNGAEGALHLKRSVISQSVIHLNQVALSVAEKEPLL